MPNVISENHGVVRHVVLNRPEKRNAINGELIHELGVALRAAATEPDVRCVSRARGPRTSRRAT